MFGNISVSVKGSINYRDLNNYLLSWKKTIYFCKALYWMSCKGLIGLTLFVNYSSILLVESSSID